MNALTTRDLSVVAGEPRVRDLLLAERLELRDKYTIRQHIRRNREELRRYGEVLGITPKTSPKGGRPSTDYYLNEAQALLVCMFSETSKAADVREQLIRVFMAYRAGELQRAPQPARMKRLAPQVPITDSRHPDFRDPLKVVDQRRAMLERFHSFESKRADEQMMRTLQHLLAPSGNGGVLRFPQFFRDKEVLAAVVRTHRSAPLDEVRELLRHNFGYRAPSRSALGRFWLRLDGLFGTGRRLH